MTDKYRKPLQYLHENNNSVQGRTFMLQALKLWIASIKALVPCSKQVRCSMRAGQTSWHALGVLKHSWMHGPHSDFFCWRREWLVWRSLFRGLGSVVRCCKEGSLKNSILIMEISPPSTPPHPPPPHNLARAISHGDIYAFRPDFLKPLAPSPPPPESGASWKPN